MSINFLHIIGILITLSMIAGVGIYSGSKVKSSSDFTTGGGRSGSLLVCGALMGSMVSGQATIGTAQMAFSFGLSAWWFTLGSGIGCIILDHVYVKPLRSSGNVTVLQVIEKEYGKKAEYTGSVLSSIGIFISIISQIIASTALLTTITPLGMIPSAVISSGFMAIYVIFGGAFGAGMGGILKLILLYFSCIIGFIVVMHSSGGLTGLRDDLYGLFVNTDFGAMSHLTDKKAVAARFFSINSRGTLTSLGSCMSLILGILSTQTYAQAIWAATDNKAARKGSLIAAFLTPPIGIACTFVGLFMRNHYVTADELANFTSQGLSLPEGMQVIKNSAQVFPAFIVNHTPSLIGGFILGTLLLTVIGGGAGLSLGVATIIMKDIVAKGRKHLENASDIIATRATIVIILFTACIMSLILPGAFINDFGFLSMGLRGAVIFVPLTFALYVKGKIKPTYILLSMILGPVAVLLGRLFQLPFDSLFLGIAINLILCGVGVIKSKTV